METRSTKMSLIKPTLIKPTQIRSALFSNLHFYYSANIACKGFHLPIREELMRMIQKKPHVGPWREKYPRLRLNKKKGFPPDFPVPYLLPGSCISHSAKHLLLTHNSIYILYLVSCVFCYVLSVYSSILLTNCSPPPSAVHVNDTLLLLNQNENLWHVSTNPEEARLKCQEPDWSLALVGLWHINNHTHSQQLVVCPQKLIILPPIKISSEIDNLTPNIVWNVKSQIGRSLTAALEHSNRLSLATEELLSGEELLRLSRSHLWFSLHARIQIWSADILSGWTFCQENIFSGPP